MTATSAAAIDAFTRAQAPAWFATAAPARYVIHGVSDPHGVELVDREALLATTGPVIVDEAYAELRFDGKTPRPLLADAPDRVWHVGTISKTIAPGLRVGWLIPPAAHHATALEHKAAADLQTSSVTQAALARLVATVDYDAIARARPHRVCRARRTRCAMRFIPHAPGCSFASPEGGFSIWIETERTGHELALLRAGPRRRRDGRSRQRVPARAGRSHRAARQLLERPARPARRSRAPAREGARAQLTRVGVRWRDEARMGAAAAFGCGAEGEPMKGDVMFTYGTDHPKMAFGAAVQNHDTPAETLVQIGDDNVDCSTYLDALSFGGPSGNFVYFSVDATTPGTVATAAVSVEHSTGNHVSINESDGMVTIDTTHRVTGSLTFTTTDQTVGTIAVSGNFDVKRCF